MKLTLARTYIQHPQSYPNKLLRKKARKCIFVAVVCAVIVVLAILFLWGQK